MGRTGRSRRTSDMEFSKNKKMLFFLLKREVWEMNIKLSW